MRTTITLDADTQHLVEKTMRDRGLSFKEAVNDAIRRGLAPDGAEQRAYTVARDLGSPRADLTKALALAGELEDEEIVRRMSEGR